MINKGVSTNAKIVFNLVRFSSTRMPKNLYYSPTLMKIIFS
jgi:hypothetical protein